jgi:hypothetical protein
MIRPVLAQSYPLIVPHPPEPKGGARCVSSARRDKHHNSFQCSVNRCGREFKGCWRSLIMSIAIILVCGEVSRINAA